jgi:hypothetical protein
MLDPTTLSQTITQIICCDNCFFWMSPRKALWTITSAKEFHDPMPPQPILSTTKDDPMQIDETIFNPLTEQKK